MKALLIAGGFGTRMRPLTYTRPKHLLPIANKPHIEHVFDHLQRHSVNECVLLTSYLADAFEKTVLDAKDRGMTVEVRHEEVPLGTAGALKNAADVVGDETFLAFNGDVLTETDLDELVRFHRERKAKATILLAPVEDPSLYGVVPTDGEGRVETFIEKPPRDEAPTNLINAGVYVIEPEVLDRIPAGEEYSSEHQLFPELVAAGEMFAMASDEYWLDVGTPDKYLQANIDALEGRFVTDAVSIKAEGSVLMGDGADVAKGAKVSSSCIGPDCVIEDGAVVERSVFLPDVIVKEGAVVRRCVLGQGVVVGPGSDLDGATLGDHETIGQEGVRGNQ